MLEFKENSKVDLAFEILNQELEATNEPEPRNDEDEDDQEDEEVSGEESDKMEEKILNSQVIDN